MNWKYLVLGAVVAAVFVVYLFKTIKDLRNMTKSEREKTIMGWLLGAVTLAEQQFGGGTGKLKLSAVWREFCRDLPWIAKVISFEKFSGFVDQALIEMRKMIETNSAVASIVEKPEA